MKDGTYIFYVLQYRKTHQSPWLKPNELERINVEEWHFCNWDWISQYADPIVNHKPLNLDSNKEISNVYSLTKHYGWWTLKYAVLAVNRLNKASKSGCFNSRSTWGNLLQVGRYEFRVAKITNSRTTEILSVDQILEAVIE